MTSALHRGGRAAGSSEYRHPLGDNPERDTDPSGRSYSYDESGGGGYTDSLFASILALLNSVIATLSSTQSVVGSTSTTSESYAMSTYQQAAFGGNNLYGGGNPNPLLSYQESAFDGVNPYSTPTVTIGGTQTGPLSSCQGATAAGIFTVFTSSMGLYVAGELAGSEVLMGTALTIATGGLAALPFIGIVVMGYLWANDPTCHG